MCSVCPGIANRTRSKLGSQLLRLVQAPTHGTTHLPLPPSAHHYKSHFKYPPIPLQIVSSSPPSSPTSLLPLCHRLWFLRPLKDLAMLTERQEAIAFFSQHHNQEVMGNLADCLRHIKNLPVRRGAGRGLEGRDMHIFRSHLTPHPSYTVTSCGRVVSAAAGPGAHEHGTGVHL